MERAYEHYRSTHVEHITSSRALPTTLRQIRPLLPAERGRLLELGCGTGELLTALRDEGFQDARGVDSSSDQVEQARENGIEVEHGGVLDFLTATTADTDVILAVDLLEHLPKAHLVDVLEAVHDRLRPGGVFIARVPNPQCPFGGAIAFGDVTHETLLAPTAMEQVLRIAGLVPDRVVAASPSRFGWRSGIRLALWTTQQRLFRLMFAVESGAGTQSVFSLNYLVRARKPETVD